MSDFGDADPEDAWDDGDPIGAKLDILERVVAELQAGRDRHEARRLDALRLVDKTPREGLNGLRLDAIREALEAV